MLILEENHPERENLSSLTEVITPEKAKTADIRAIRLGIINLMPKKDETERDILQCIGHSVLQIEPVWIKMFSKKTRKEKSEYEEMHVEKFYKSMEEATEKENLDGLIITGAPIENIEFLNVDYWSELKQILDYSKENIYSSMYLCWAAMAASYHFYNTKKVPYPQKLTGIFPMKNIHGDNSPISRGMNPIVSICQSRGTDIDQSRLKELLIENKIVNLFESDEKPVSLCGQNIGITVFSSNDYTKIFNLGHLEYNEETINQEVIRDRSKNPPAIYPVENYYNYNVSNNGIPYLTWKADRTLFYRNFLNLIYDKMNKNKKDHVKFVYKSD